MCRASSIHSTPLEYGFDSAASLAQLVDLYISAIKLLQSHLDSLPDGVFETELPELDIWYIDELEVLRGHLRRSLGETGSMWRTEESVQRVCAAWNELRGVAKRRYGWDLSELLTDKSSQKGGDDSEEEEEEGEYAPIIVES